MHQLLVGYIFGLQVFGSFVALHNRIWQLRQNWNDVIDRSDLDLVYLVYKNFCYMHGFLDSSLIFHEMQIDDEREK
jgi:hypothetical protein